MFVYGNSQLLTSYCCTLADLEKAEEERDQAKKELECTLAELNEV